MISILSPDCKRLFTYEYLDFLKEMKEKKAWITLKNGKVVMEYYEMNGRNGQKLYEYLEENDFTPIEYRKDQEYFIISKSIKIPKSCYCCT